MSEGEFDAIAALRALFAWPAASLPRHGDVQLGIGDDAAVLAGGLVLSVDAQVEHVHFERAWLDDAAIGYRAFVAALSDLAAMGALPRAALSSLILPDAALATAVAAGQAEAAREYACPVVGGNLSRGDVLSITTTVLGHAEAPLTRGGAQPGHTVFVAGDLGAAAAGLRAHQLQDTRFARVRSAWARPTARIAEGIAAARFASAAIDLSDGLLQDAGHLAAGSGVRLALSRAALQPFAVALHAEAQALVADPWDWVLRGGEDYALLITSSGAAPAGFVAIGTVVAGDGITLDGETVAGAGHDHFAARD